jgi:hypothetical protein
MPNYQNGKIYKITGGGLTYLGSTTLKLCVRLANHKQDLKRGKWCSSQKVICFDDAVITLIENYNCNNREELVMRERYWYDNMDCVNKIKPYITEEELYQQKKEYRELHKEEHKIYEKKYCELHKEDIKIYMKKYGELHKEELKIYKKTYRELHKEDRKIYDKKYYEMKKKRDIPSVF